MSAYVQLNGELDFNRTPIAPPRTITLVHNKPNNRGTRDPRGHKGWYARPAMIHYRCLISYTPKTAKERVSYTTEFSPSNLTFPIMSSKYVETHAAVDLIHTLINQTPTIPLTTLGDKQTAALKPLAEIFNMAAPPTSDTTSKGEYPRSNSRSVPCATSEGGPTSKYIIPTMRRTKTVTSTRTHNHPQRHRTKSPHSTPKINGNPRVPQVHKHNSLARCLQ